jgi:hypothetical protein
MEVTDTKHWNKTRYSMLFYRKFNTGSWYLGMKSEGDTEVVTIGLPYRSKEELLSDLKNQYDIRCAPLGPDYRGQRDVLKALLEGLISCYPEVLNSPIGQRSIIALNALNNDDNATITK